MKINPDCVRSVLIALEDGLSVGLNRFVAMSRNEVLTALREEAYPVEDILYSLVQLHENRYVVSDFKTDPQRGEYSLQYIYYITPAGHDFLASVRNENNWRKRISPVINSLESISLSVLSSVAQRTIEASLLSGALLP